MVQKKITPDAKVAPAKSVSLSDVQAADKLTTAKPFESAVKNSTTEKAKELDTAAKQIDRGTKKAEKDWDKDEKEGDDRMDDQLDAHLKTHPI